MRKLVQGVQRFLRTVHALDVELYQRLSAGQSPDTMLIACSDSRVVPHLICQASPGDLFVLRNAGNIVPPAEAATGAEGSAVEFAVAALGVRDIVVLGHSHCGAMRAVVEPERLESLPLTAKWLEHAGEARRAVAETFADADPAARLMGAIEANVLAQLENLQSYPFVAEAREAERLRLHGWVWHIDSGVVRAFDPPSGVFVAL